MQLRYIIHCANFGTRGQSLGQRVIPSHLHTVVRVYVQELVHACIPPHEYNMRFDQRRIN